MDKNNWTYQQSKNNNWKQHKNNNNQEFYIEEQYYSDFDDGFLDINRLRLLGLLYNICIDLNVTYTYIEDKEKYSYYIFKPHKKY